MRECGNDKVHVTILATCHVHPACGGWTRHRRLASSRAQHLAWPTADYLSHRIALRLLHNQHRRQGQAGRRRAAGRRVGALQAGGRRVVASRTGAASPKLPGAIPGDALWQQRPPAPVLSLLPVAVPATGRQWG
jgi:hypothetical protein